MNICVALIRMIFILVQDHAKLILHVNILSAYLLSIARKQQLEIKFKCKLQDASVLELSNSIKSTDLTISC